MLLFYPVLQIETEKKISTSHNNPFELYAEHSFHVRFQSEMQKSKAWSYHQGGIHLIQSQNGINKSVISSDLALYPLLKSENSFKNTAFSLKGDTEKLERLCRNLLIQFPQIKTLRSHFEANSKYFFFSSDRLAETHGLENQLLFICDFDFEKKNQHVKLSKAFTQQDLELLLDDVSERLISQDEIEKLLINPWPSPQGSLPVLWSEKSMGSWALLLLQFLTRESKTLDQFESFCEGLPTLKFQIIDNWKPQLGFDAEGNKRNEVFLVGPQNEIPFFSDLKGFSRRSSYEQFPVTVPWQPALFGENRASSLLKEMKKGVSIQDFDLLHFDTRTAQAKLKINRAYLVHDGKEGDPIEPLEWTVSIFEVFESLELFSDEIRPQPLTWKTANQEFFVEMNAPQGLSQSLNFPGSVPLNYYW